jgi:hypothetical protein
MAEQESGAERGPVAALGSDEAAARPSYGPHDVLTPDDVRAALGPFSDDKWEDIRARIPWSDALGARTLRIQWAVLLDWLASHTRKVA